MKAAHLTDEAAAFDARIRERVAHGHIPDLRRVQPCDWFFNNQWRRPEYVDAVFGEYFRFAASHIPPRSHVLEVGSGPGHMALELARHGHHVTGLELSPECVSIARRLADENPFRDGFGSLEYVAADFLTWECSDRFDAICFFLVLHHFDDPVAVLDRVLALLRPGGTVTVIEPARDWFSPLNAAVAMLIRLLLSQSGRWYEHLELPTTPAQLSALVGDCLMENREARDRNEAEQSPQDNSSYADAMLAALRDRFEQIEYRPGHAILPRMIGGVRGTESEAREMAAFLTLFDRSCIDAGLLQPGAFYFAGKSPM
jgi:2-polyprenyl-3-methyl-5-hydroxy-6-metoxy-1,4-benzoquinol methylase